MQKQVGYPGCRQTEETMHGYESFTLVLKSNYTRKHKGQLPSSSYNHNALTTLITSSSGSMKVPLLQL